MLGNSTPSRTVGPRSRALRLGRAVVPVRRPGRYGARPLLDHGGFSPQFSVFGYEEGCSWGAKTPGVSIRRLNAQNCRLVCFRVLIPIGSEVRDRPAPLSIACFACPSRLRRPQFPVCACRSQFPRSGAIQPPGARSSLDRGRQHLARTPLVRGQPEPRRITPVSASRRPQVR